MSSKNPSDLQTLKRKELQSKEEFLLQQEKDLAKREQLLYNKEETLLTVEDHLKEDLDQLRCREQLINSQRKEVEELVDLILSYEEKLKEKEEVKRKEIHKLISSMDENKDSEKISELREREKLLRGTLKNLVDVHLEFTDKEKDLLSEESKLFSEEKKIIKQEIKHEDKLQKVEGQEQKIYQKEKEIDKKKLKLLKSLQEIKKFEEKSEKLCIQELTFKPKPGRIYLINEKQILVSGVIPWRSMNFFQKHVSKNRPGLVISRTNPERLAKQCDIDNMTCRWLSETGNHPIRKKKTLFNLEKISLTVSKFISKNKKSALFLDGLEYMITHMDFEPTLSLIQFLRDYISDKETFVVIPVDFGSVKEHHLKLIERECHVIV